MRPVDVVNVLQEVITSDEDGDEIRERLKSVIDALKENRDVYYDENRANLYIDIPIDNNSREETFYTLCHKTARLLRTQLDNLSVEGKSDMADLDDCRARSIQRLRERLDAVEEQSVVDASLFDPEVIPDNFTVVRAIKNNS